MVSFLHPCSIAAQYLSERSKLIHITSKIHFKNLYVLILNNTMCKHIPPHILYNTAQPSLSTLMPSVCDINIEYFMSKFDSVCLAGVYRQT